MSEITPLTRLQRICLMYLRERGEAPDVEASSIEGRVVVLRNGRGEVIAEVSDGVTVETGDSAQVGIAKVRPFVVRIRCFICDRSTVRSSDAWVVGEVWACRCGARNVVPRDPFTASRG